MKKLVSLLTVFALELLSACAWWSEPDPDNMRDETLWALSSPETLQTVFPDMAATGEEQDGFLPVGTVNYESRVEDGEATCTVTLHIGGRDYACTVEGSVVTNKLNDTYTCTQGMLTGTMEADGTQWTVTGLLREFNTTSRIMLSLEFLPAEYDPDATPAWLVIGPDVTTGELREAYEAYYGVTEGE